jgi:hypothetical protein
MIRKIINLMLLITVLTGLSSCASRNVRIAEDITPGNLRGQKLDWRYGARDIRIQVSKLNAQLMDRWFAKTGYSIFHGKPRLVITEIDNRTDQYISTDMIRDVIECAAVTDGRYTVVVGDACDENELDYMMNSLLTDPKYSSCTRPTAGNVTAPQFLAKIRITKAVTSDQCYDYEDYRMNVTLYNIENQEVVDSAADVLSKRVRR